MHTPAEMQHLTRPGPRMIMQDATPAPAPALAPPPAKPVPSVPPKTAEAALSGAFKPFIKDPAKQARYELFLRAHGMDAVWSCIVGPYPNTEHVLHYGCSGKRGPGSARDSRAHRVGGRARAGGVRKGTWRWTAVINNFQLSLTNILCTNPRRQPSSSDLLRRPWHHGS